MSVCVSACVGKTWKEKTDELFSFVDKMFGVIDPMQQLYRIAYSAPSSFLCIKWMMEIMLCWRHSGIPRHSGCFLLFSTFFFHSFAQFFSLRMHCISMALHVALLRRSPRIYWLGTSWVASEKWAKVLSSFPNTFPFTLIQFGVRWNARIACMCVVYIYYMSAAIHKFANNRIHNNQLALPVAAIDREHEQ